MQCSEATNCCGISGEVTALDNRTEGTCCSATRRLAHLSSSLDDALYEWPTWTGMRIPPAQGNRFCVMTEIRIHTQEDCSGSQQVSAVFLSSLYCQNQPKRHQKNKVTHLTNLCRFPPQQRHRVLGKYKGALAVPLRLLDADVLLARDIDGLHVGPRHRVHLDRAARHALQRRLKVTLVADVDDRHVHKLFVVHHRADVQPRRPVLEHPLQPRRRRLSRVRPTLDVRRDCPPTHVLAEE